MFRRKRFSESAASIPWWPTEGGDHRPSNGGQPGGPAGFGLAGAPPLAAHDPFGGWPAFGDGYGDSFAGNGPMDGMPGHGHPANGWPLNDGYPDAADPFGAPRPFHPDASQLNAQPQSAQLHSAQPNRGHSHNGRSPGAQAYPANQHPANQHPANQHPANQHTDGQPGVFPSPQTPSTPYPTNGLTMAAHPATAHPSDYPGFDEASEFEDADSEGIPDWIPLLTHPIGGQRFQPDLEAAPDATARPAAGRPPRRRNGRRPKGRRQQYTPADEAAASSVTTWIPTIPTVGAPDDPEALGTVEPAAGRQPTPGGESGSAPSSPRAVPTPVPPAAPDPAEASSLAGAFAADYLSWDQDNPARRGQVLSQYLPTDIKGDPSLLGWSGKGRQRSEFSLPGAVHPDGEGRVLVDVRVRVTPFRQVGPADRLPAPAPEARLEVAGVPAVAPAPSARGWKSQDSHWVRLTVPVTRDQGRLVVDTWDEQLGEDSEEPTPTADGSPAGSASATPDGDDPGTAEDADDAPAPPAEKGSR